MASESGVRFELKRKSPAHGAVAYDLELRTAEGHWVGSASCEKAGQQFHLSFGSEGPPEWCINILAATLRGVARDAAAKGEYPRRIARWRPEPSASAEEEGA